ASRGATVLAEVRGHGSAFDGSRGADDGRASRAVARAIAAALADAGAGADEVGFVSAAANGSPAGDRQEACGIAAALAKAPEIRVAALKAMLGESLGAGGALQAIDALETWRDGRLPGIPGLEVEPGIDLSLSAASRVIGGGGLALLVARAFDGGAT